MPATTSGPIDTRPAWGWGTATLVETNDSAGSLSVRFAMGANGNAVAVWLQGTGSVVSVWANHYTVGAGWGTPILLEEDDAGHAQAPDVAVDASGNALAVWYQRDPTRNNIWFSRYVRGGGWGTATLVEMQDTEARFPRIAVDAKGNALAVWHQVQGSVLVVWANRYTSEEGWGTASVIQSNDTEAASAPQIVMDAAGNALAVWVQAGTLWYNRYINGSGRGTAAPIDPDQNGDATLGALVVDASGNALATWSQLDGARQDIYVNRFDRMTETPSAAGHSSDADVSQVASSKSLDAACPAHHCCAPRRSTLGAGPYRLNQRSPASRQRVPNQAHARSFQACSNRYSPRSLIRQDWFFLSKNSSGRRLWRKQLANCRVVGRDEGYGRQFALALEGQAAAHSWPIGQRRDSTSHGR